MACKKSLLRLSVLLAIPVAIAVVSVLPAHGVFEKVMWADKANFATRGSMPGTQKSTMYFMQPPEFMLGFHDSVGWRITLQDADASTAENITLSYVKFAADGKSPDTSPSGVIYSSTLSAFGRGLSGNIGYRFTFSINVPTALPEKVGIGVTLAGNSKWPADGMSVHAQLNLPQDRRRPRIMAPYDKEVWTYEATATGLQALGGRSLDTLNVGGLYIEPTLTPFIDTYAYDDLRTRPERVEGADALFPVAQRGDEFGVHIDGGQVGAGGFAILFAARSLNATPIPLQNGEFRLGILAPEPYEIVFTSLDSIGSRTVGPIPFFNFPLDFRKFWLQALILNPFSLELEATDAIRIRGQ